MKVVAERMVSCVRATDTVVRLGGDEFVILLFDQPKSADIISATLQKVRAAIAEPVHVDGHDLEVTCSIGLANYPNDGTDADTLLANADAAPQPFISVLVANCWPRMLPPFSCAWVSSDVPIK